jgi:hypothetical protein
VRKERSDIKKHAPNETNGRYCYQKAIAIVLGVGQIVDTPHESKWRNGREIRREKRGVWEKEFPDEIRPGNANDQKQSNQAAPVRFIGSNVLSYCHNQEYKKENIPGYFNEYLAARRYSHVVSPTRNSSEKLHV